MFLPIHLNSGRNFFAIRSLSDTTLTTKFTDQKLHLMMIQVLSKPLLKL